MAYEIPQQLQHKEKIMFGLTFPQLGWAILFLSIIAWVLTRKMDLVTRITFAIFVGLIGVGFIFFDISIWFKRFMFFFSFRYASLMSPKMVQLLGITKIENDIVKTDKDIAILQITPINFNIKENTDQESIIVGFQKFLNSLDFPVQLIVTTSTLNLENYFKILKKRVHDKKMYEDFKEFMEDTIKKNNMRTRDFYLIIPKQSDLDIQCKICTDKLTGLGLKIKRLDDAELVKKIFLFFNNDGVKRKPQENIDNGVHYLIAPDEILDSVDYFKVNEKFSRVVSAVGYPRNVESGFLDKIISSNDDFDISIHIEPFPIDSMMIMLNKELQKQRADLYAEELKKSINPSLEIKYHDTRKVLEDLQKGNEKLFNVSLYINCKGKTKEELDLLTKKVESELNSIMIIPQAPIFRQINAYKSMMPIGKDELKIKRNIATKALSAFFPFTSPFLTVEPTGVMLGLNKNKVPFVKDIFSLNNANGLILATSGAGKSYFTKLLISRQLLNGTKVIVIDPQTEYLGLIKQCKGELISISKDSETIINPLDLMGHEFIEKRLALMDMFKIMFGELTEIQKSILDKAITETYARKGIHADSYNHKIPPTLMDLYKVLQEMDKKASQMEKVTYRALINRLYMYTEGVFNFLDKQSCIDFKKDFVCFNIGEMPKQVKPIIMFLILDYVFMKMKSDKERKLLVIDEAWSLLGHAEEASYIFEIVKTCRKFNMGLLLITQDVADLVNSPAGHAALANTSYTLLLRQKPAIIDSIVRTFHLSQNEKEYLLTATQGKGILIMDNDHQELEVIASPKEHEQITTNADEILKKQRKKKDDRKEINIGLDIERGLYYGKELNIEDKNYLFNHGYKAGYFVPIGKSNQVECIVKINDIESIGHTFLVQNIKQELENYTKKIRIEISKDADIIFKNKKGETIALEIETGTRYDKNRKELENKINDLNLKYKNKLYIILTDNNYKSRYQQFHKQTMLRQDIPQFLSANFPRKNKNTIPAKKSAEIEPNKHK